MSPLAGMPIQFSLLAYTTSHAGIKYLYVHVAQNNQAAKELYCTRCGFHEEQKENESYARALGRPPRLLLCQALAA